MLNIFSIYFNLSLYNSAGTVLSQFNTGADNIYTVGLPSPGYYYLGVSGGEYLYESQEGSYKVDITATDPSGLSISEPESFNLLLWAAEIGKINKQPILVSPIPDQVLNSAIDSPYRLDVSSHFSDNDQLNYSLSIDSTSYTDPNILNDLADNSLPDWLFFDASSGVFTGDSGQVNMGEIHFKVTASDVSGLTVSDSFALQIKNKQESIVNTRTNGNQTQAVVSFIADEQYLITWLGSNEEGEIAVFGQFYENGIKIGSEFLVDNETSNRNKKSNTSTLDNGNKVVVEQSPRDDGYYKISGQFYSNTGDKISTNFEISADSAFNQYSPTVVSLPESEFVVAWHADNEKNESNIVAQRFNGDGDIIGRNIINGTAANDVLRGTTFDDEILCFAGQDSISSSLGNDYVNGGAGVDTYIYSKAKGDFSLKGGTGESSQRWQITTDDKTDNLVNIERLFFSDTKVALDLDGNAGFVAKIISVLFGASFVTNKKFVGEALSLLDTEEGSQNELISTILNMQGFSLDEHTTNDRLYQSLVATLWDNAVSGDYTPELAKPFIEKLNEGSLSMVEIVNLAANTDYNKTAIDFTGLMTSGIEYL